MQILIKSGDAGAVAGACAEHWQKTLRRRLVSKPAGPNGGDGNDKYEVLQPHNGCVQIIGHYEWPAAEFEGLAQFLSQRLGTIVVACWESTFSSSLVFSVHEAGVKRFRFEQREQLNAKGDNTEEKVTVEGEEWVKTHGFTPGKDGMKEFAFWGGEDVTRALGIKVWDNPNPTPAYLMND